MKNIDLNKNDRYEIFKALTEGVDISEAVHEDYARLIDIIGEEMAFKVFVNYGGCEINCPKYLYKQEFVIKLAIKEKDKRQREKIAIHCGYTAGRLESLVKKYLKNNPSQE